ncbi:hypothetical protein JMJ35_004964 [Cladonia borealis]|uniref:DUF2423 domain-containing protein n=1 Tax=Cladonia borealis TaxID=184061 RepID=A0AA39R126_9LECA|nr:hypothetical protein JMJ35_004964 [Cladonia borealis]
MAKGLRSSRNKANNSKLRSNIFGPVEDERKQRLSAKLLELASKPATKAGEDAKMVDEQEPTSPKEAEAEADIHSNEQEMDVEQDNGSIKDAESRPRSSGRIQKKGRGKAKAAMIFPVYRKGKRVGPHLNKRQRRKSLRP